MWIQIALFVVSLVVSYALQPKPQRPKAAAFEEFDFPTVEDGTPQIVVFGDVWLTDWTVLGVGNYRTSNIVVKQKGLFGSKKTTTGYRYHMSLHMGLCRGLDDLIEIKVGDRTAWTGTLAASGGRLSIKKPNLFGGDKGEGGISGSLIICHGRPDQPILGELSAIFGVVPAYRGVVTFFYDGLVCSNSPYPKPWSFRVRRVTSDWDGAVWYADKAVIWLEDNKIKAMNPAHVLYEVQTNTMWGRGFAAGQLDLNSFKAAADQLYNEKFGVCLAWRRQDSLSNFIQQILDQIGAALYVDRTTGLWRLTLIRDNYQLESLPQYSYQNGLLRIEEDNNAALDLVTNQVVVTFKDPIKNQDETIRAENIAAIQKHGLISENKSYAGIPTANLAGRIAARDMKIAQSNLKKFKLIFDRRAYAMQPASVFKLALPERGIASITVRAIRVEHNDSTNGEITVTVVQDVFGLPSSNFIQSQPSLWQPPDLTAKPVSQQLLYEVPFAELLREFSIQELQQIQNQSYVGVVAQQPTSMHLDFDIFAKASTEAAYVDVGNGEFGFVSEIDADIAQTAEPITCNLNRPIDDAVQVGDRAFLGNEIVRIESINRETNSLVLARGCIDTVPIAHNVQTMLWVYSNIASVAESRFASTQTVDMKLVTHVSQDMLNQDLATVASLALNNRKERPYPPANVKINKAYFPQEITGDLTVSWSHRNRLLQTDRIPGFVDAAASAEENTTYNLRIFDASNAKVFEKLDLDVTSFTWSIPRIFDGEMETVLDIPMTGVNGSTAFADNSENHFPIVNNFNTLIKTDTDTTSGSSAFFDAAILKTASEYQKLDIYSEDHCIEFRLKTATAGDYLNGQPNIIYMYIQHDRQSSENISIDYLISTQPYDDKLVIEVVGKRLIASTESETAVITYTAENLNPDSYYDIAIQCTKAGTEIIGGTEITQGLIKIFVSGVERHSETLAILSQGYPCGLRLNLSPNVHHGSKVAINGLRITKRNGGRYNANYTPQPFMTGSTNDPYWNDVVLLLPMTGNDGGHTFKDVSVNPATLTASDMVITKPDIKANGNSTAYFNHPALVVEAQEILNLKDKSFIIEGRAKCQEGVIFNITDSMMLSFNQYQLRLSNYEMPEPQTVILNLMAGIDADWRPDRYFNFKVTRDAASGKVTLMFDEKAISGSFNPSFSLSPSLVLCPNVGAKASFNGFKLQTADATATLVPNVKNPLRVELESKRDGLLNHQSFSTTTTVK